MEILTVLMWFFLFIAIMAIVVRYRIWIFDERNGIIVVWATWLEFAIGVLIFLASVISLIKAIQNGESKLWIDILLPILCLIISICSFKHSKRQYKKNMKKLRKVKRLLNGQI